MGPDVSRAVSVDKAGYVTALLSVLILHDGRILAASKKNPKAASRLISSICVPEGRVVKL
jgi:hypothetical protein